MHKTILFLVLSALALNMNTVWAQFDTSGTLGPTSGFISGNADGAIDNRDSANQYYKNAHNDYHQGHAHHDGAQIARALGEAQRAFALDNQAQEFARAALQGLQSQSQQRDPLATSNASSVNVPQLEQIANSQSPYASEVQQEFASDGYSLGTDQTTLSTPAGTVANSSGGTNVIKSSDSVTRTIASTPGTTVVPGQIPVPSQAQQDATGANASANWGKGSGPNAELTTSSVRIAQEVTSEHSLTDAEKKRLDQNRSSILKQMGLSADSQNPEKIGPIRAKTEDIFQAVHNHYESLRGGGTFFEASLPADASPKTRESLPEFSKGF